MPFFHALATDYDGTLALDGVVAEATIASLERLRATGRRLVLVTGRELTDLERVCPRLDLFDRVVAENGGVLYVPLTRERRCLAPAVPVELADGLRRAGVEPLAVGDVLVATREPHEATVLRLVRELGLDLQIIFNKGAVMVLPAGITKASGLAAALDALGLSPHNTVAVGDAENDLAMLRLCGCAVAVGDALEAVRQAADLAMAGPDGEGVVQLVERWLADERSLLDGCVARHRVPVGRTLDGDHPVALRPDRGCVLITGTSGGGKSTLATALLEHLADTGHQLCLFDPEGDYDAFEHAVTFGDAKTVVAPDHILDALRKQRLSVNISLQGSSVDDRPRVLAELFPAIQAVRTKTGRPHWMLVDEAHHVLTRAQGERDDVVVDPGLPTIFITVHPDMLAEPVLRSIGTVLLIGRDSPKLMPALARAFHRSCPELPAQGPEPGQAILWRCRTDEPPAMIVTERPRHAMKRHTRKYAVGTLPPERSFYFRGADGRLAIRAQNLAMFLQIGDGVDEDTYRFHLGNGEIAGWMRACIKDDELADEIAGVAEDVGGDVADARARVREIVERRYTAPAMPD